MSATADFGAFSLQVVHMGSIASFAFLPWLHRSAVRSIRYKCLLSRIALGALAVSFVCLGELALLPATTTNVWMVRLFATTYFGYFWLMPLYTRLEAAGTSPVRVRSAASQR